MKIRDLNLGQDSCQRTTTMNRLFFKTMHGTITIARCFPALSDIRSHLFIRWFRVNAKLLSDSDNIDDELEKSLQRKKPPLGIANRHLKDPSKVYKFNAWYFSYFQSMPNCRHHIFKLYIFH